MVRSILEKDWRQRQRQREREREREASQVIKKGG
jgi:hypothetical protein